MGYDLVIKNGMVVDGSGGARYRGDVGVKDGKIARIGKPDGEIADFIFAVEACHLDVAGAKPVAFAASCGAHAPPAPLREVAVAALGGAGVRVAGGHLRHRVRHRVGQSGASRCGAGGSIKATR
mgnify:CR=1 FL=1